MGLTLTERARNAAGKIVKEPAIVLCIDGISTKFGSARILEIVKIGDPGLLIDGTWQIGGFREVQDQSDYISLSGTTTSIRQQLEQDRGRSSSISSMTLELQDINGEISEIISRGQVITDILGVKVKIYLGFADGTSFPEDYVIIFRGLISEVDARQGTVKLVVDHPDKKKRQSAFFKQETQASGSIGVGDTVITVDSTSGFLVRTTDPAGVLDTSFTPYIKIDDEIIQYTAVTGTQFTGCTRAALGTTAAAHANDATVESFYRLEGNAIDLALKLMASSKQGAYVSGVEITNFVKQGDASLIDNSMFFRNISLSDDYGVVVGDYITTNGATNGANNVSNKVIAAITENEFGTTVEVSGVSFVEESATTGVMSIRSQYDSLPDGAEMDSDFIDIAEHLRIKQLFLSSFEYDFYLKDTIENLKDFIEQQIYKPASAYSLPRKARSSMGYFIGPIPSESTLTLNKENITHPSRLSIKRTINKHFANTIVYRYEVDPLEEKFLRGVVTQNATSLSEIPVGTKPLVISAEGMRDALSASNLATAASNRKLDRFKYGAEFLQNVNVTYETGYAIEVGDILVLDGQDLNLLNSADGTRDKAPKFFEVVNKSLNIKTGAVALDLVDSGFDGFNRYGLIGPSSAIKSGLSTTKFIIENDGSSFSPYGTAEFQKWNRYENARVKVRSSDFTTRFAQTYITGISGNTITVNGDLGFTPQAGDRMELADYDFTDVTDQIKLLYVHMRDSAFGDGQTQYVML
jgi:hypothetical protein